MPGKMTHEQYEARASEWQAHLDAHGEQPTNRDTDDKEACRLYSWMNTQRLHSERGQLKPERRSALDSLAPTWQVAPLGPQAGSENHGPRAREFAAFVETHGRSPSQLAVDDDERRLNRWLANLKAAYTRGTVAAETVATVEEHLPGWTERKREVRDDVVREPWGERLTKVGRYLAEHDGIYPGEDDPSLKHWLRQQRLLLDRGELPAERARRLDKAVPLWRDPNSRTKTKTAARVRALQVFVAEHDRLPSHNADEAEAQLADWLSKRTDTEDSELRSQLDEAAPGWTEAYATRIDGVNRRTRERVLEIGAFIAEHGRNPVAQGTTTENESNMGFWLSRTRRKDREGKLDEPLRSLLDEHAAGWNVTRSSSDAASAHSPDEAVGETPQDVEWIDLDQYLPHVDSDAPETRSDPSPASDLKATTVGEWVDTRDHLDHHDWAVVATDKSHPGLATTNPYEFARRVLEFHTTNQ